MKSQDFIHITKISEPGSTG